MYVLSQVGDDVMHLSYNNEIKYHDGPKFTRSQFSMTKLDHL